MHNLMRDMRLRGVVRTLSDELASNSLRTWHPWRYLITSAFACAVLFSPCAGHAQSVGPPPPALLFAAHGDSVRAMRAVDTALQLAGFTFAARSTGFVTTDRKALAGCSGYASLVRVSASVIPVGDHWTAVVIWGVEKSSPDGLEHAIVADDSQASDGGCAWKLLNTIRTSVLAEIGVTGGGMDPL